MRSDGVGEMRDRPFVCRYSGTVGIEDEIPTEERRAELSDVTIAVGQVA